MKSYKLKNVAIGYGERVVAQDINATLNAGELTCLIGRNGAGKSTLLRSLSAFQPLLGGTVTYSTSEPLGSSSTDTEETDGLSVESMTPNERARLIGVVLTERIDLQNMTVRELVAMGRAPYTGFFGTLTDADRDIVQEAISMVRIDDLVHRMVHTLSDGERQKVMIAKALAQQTPVIFLDEPTAFLDFPSKVETMQLLSRLARELRKIVFLSTHDVEIALQMADRLWLMERGKGVTIGSPRELADNGCISRFVERKNVLFDTESLTIKIG